MKILSKLKIPKSAMICIAILIVALIAFIAVRLSQEEKQAMPVNDYNEIEQQLADAVTDYINENVVFPETAAAEIAHEAVNSYRIIIGSDIDIVNDDHTTVIQERIKAAFTAASEDNDQTDLSEENEDRLSACIAEIVWRTILSQIQTITKDSDLESEYYYLAESIQGQIDKLEERRIKVSIQADIKNKNNLLPEELLSMIEGMTDEELQELMDLLGLSYDELYDLLASANRDFDKELQDKLDSLKEELMKELSGESASSTNGTNGKAGQNGKDGRDGQDGQDGKDGKNGTDGLNGKTTYIAYADNISGANFSLTPTETSKYIGTCITDATKQPTDLASYSNWQPYRSHIITETTDENGVTTVHIH